VSLTTVQGEAKTVRRAVGPDRAAHRGEHGHLRGWCKQADIDAGRRPGTTTSEVQRIKELERENRELKRANEILLAASSFFARELDPRLPW
jgi:transposase